MIIVATTSLAAVDPPNANRWNAARACQNPENIEKKTLVGRKKEGDRIQYKEDNFWNEEENRGQRKYQNVPRIG